MYLIYIHKYYLESSLGKFFWLIGVIYGCRLTQFIILGYHILPVAKPPQTKLQMRIFYSTYKSLDLVTSNILMFLYLDSKWAKKSPIKIWKVCIFQQRMAKKFVMASFRQCHTSVDHNNHISIKYMKYLF